MAQEDRKTPTLQQWVSAVMHVESRGNPNAVSPVGARGTMQTMPGTLVDPGFGVVPARDDTPQELERVGKDYLNAMLQRYDDPRMALAAYNWGPGRVDAALKRHGTPDAVLANAPKETQDYVPKVLKRLGVDAPLVARTAPVQETRIPAGTDVFDMTDMGARERAVAGWEGGPIGSGSGASDVPTKKPKLNSFEEGLIMQGRIEGSGLGSVEGAQAGGQVVRSDIPAAMGRVANVNAQTDVTPQSERITSQVQALEGQALEDQARREAWTFGDKWGSFFDSGPLAALTRVIADQQDEVEAAPDGWTYHANMDEYETPDLSWEERTLLRESRSPQEVQENQATIRRRRWASGIQQDMSGGAQVGFALLSGVSDPVNAAAGFGVGSAARALGVGTAAAIRAGQPGQVLVRGAVEGAIGNMAVDTGLIAAGEDIRGQDFLINAGAGLLLGTAGNLWSARSANINRLANNYINFNNELRADAINTATTELGEGSSPAVIQRRAEEIMTERERRWREASIMDVPDADRFFSRPNPEGTPTELEGGQFETGVTGPDEIDFGIDPALYRGENEFSVPGGRFYTTDVEYARKYGTTVREIPDVEGTVANLDAALATQHVDTFDDELLGDTLERLIGRDNTDTVLSMIARGGDGTFTPIRSFANEDILTKLKEYGVDAVSWKQGTGTTVALTGDKPSVVAPARGDYYKRREGNLAWTESRELRQGIEAAEQSGNASDLFRAVTKDTGTPEHLRRLAWKLVKAADDTNMGYVANSRLSGQAATYAGAYFRDTHVLSAKLARPDIILHEGTHGAVANIQRTPKHLLPEKARIAVQELDDQLANVRMAFAELPQDQLDPSLAGLLNDPQGPISNSIEFTAYAMTDKRFQEWLHTIPAPVGSTAANAWQWFRDLVADMLGLSAGDRTALDEVIRSTGDLIDFVDQNPAEASNIIGTEALRAGSQAAESAPAQVGTATGITAKQRKDIDNRYSLKARVSDDSERKLMAELLYRSERILANNDVDAARLGTWLKKANLEATSTTMLSDESPVSRALAIMLLENPEGAAGRRATTAAIDRAQRFEEYIGNSVRGIAAAKELWIQEQAIGKYGSIIHRDQYAKQFNALVTEEMLNRQMGRQTQPSRAIKEAADALDPSYLRMLHDQRLTGSVGAQRLPEGGEAGYFHRQWQTGKLRGMSAPQRKAFLSGLKDQLVKTAEYDDEFANELSVKMLERFERRAMGAAEQSAVLYSSDTADIVRDSLKAMGLNEEEITKNLNRFGRGGAGYTKGRIELDMLQLYPDGMGGDGKIRLMDYIEQDQEQLVRQYASRAAGEVALSKYGIQGEAGIKLVRDALRITGAEDKTVKAFDQVMAEFIGKPVGSGDPNILTNVRLLTQATRLGSASFNQMGVYGDAVAVLGPSRVFEAMGAIPRLRKELLDTISGKPVSNPIIGGLETMGADFGTGDYRIMGMGTIDEHASMSGAETVGVLSQAIRYSANAVRIMSGHRMLIGVQSRGLAEQIVQKAWQYIRDGVEDKALADMGLQPALVARLRQVMDQVVEFDGNGKVKVFDPDRAGVEFNDDLLAFKNLVVRGAGQLLQREFIGETGKWAHDGFLKLLFQFRTFSLVAHQKQLGRNIAVHGGAKAALIVGAAASIAIPIHMARVASRTALMPEDARAAYLEEQLSPLVMGRQVMNYVSGLGLLPDVLDVGGGVAAGWAGVAGVDLPAWAKPTGGRGSMQQGSLIGGQFAPGIGLVNDYAQAAAGNTGRIRSTIPGNTLPYIVPFFLGAEARLED